MTKFDLNVKRAQGHVNLEVFLQVYCFVFLLVGQDLQNRKMRMQLNEKRKKA